MRLKKVFCTIKGLELGFIDLLKKEYSDLTPILMSSFDYNDETQIFTIQKKLKLKSHLDVRLRIKYYLISYLRRIDRENKSSTFDEIVLYLLPLLRNGSTPENQTILNVLEDIGEHIGHSGWRLKQEGQMTLPIWVAIADIYQHLWTQPQPFKR